MDARTGLPVVGMVGAGQLARMTHQAAIALGQSLRVLADAADDSAAQVARRRAGRRLPLPGRPAALRGRLRRRHLRPRARPERAHRGAGRRRGRRLPGPGRLALRAGQGPSMRAGWPSSACRCPRWVDLSAADDPAARRWPASATDVGWPLVLKASRGGYDGKGVWVVDSPAAGARR